MSHLQKRPKREIQVVDATAVLTTSDESHQGRTTIKRKQAAQLQAKEEREERIEQSIKRKKASQDHALSKEVQLGELNQDRMKDLREDITEVAKEKFSNAKKTQLKVEKLEALGATVTRHKLSREIMHRTTMNRLDKAEKYYKHQQDMGLASGMVNPKVLHKKKMDEKYGEKRDRGMKLHNFGKMAKDGTLSIGKSSIKRTQEDIRKSRNGGKSSGRIFKDFSK